MIEVVRSPARVSWHVKCNGITIETTDTINEADKVAFRLAKKFKMTYQGVSRVRQVSRGN